MAASASSRLGLFRVVRALIERIAGAITVAVRENVAHPCDRITAVHSAGIAVIGVDRFVDHTKYGIAGIGGACIVVIRIDRCSRACAIRSIDIIGGACILIITRCANTAVQAGQCAYGIDIRSRSVSGAITWCIHHFDRIEEQAAGRLSRHNGINVNIGRAATDPTEFVESIGI